jgi:hypothetical protein
VISVVDNGYTPGGAVTNGFDIQTPSAVHDGTAAATQARGPSLIWSSHGHRGCRGDDTGQ